jgi:putative glutamine amidotransferase
MADGLLKAFQVDSAGSFALGVQWHPEWQYG